jgi:hypothetical protein
MSLGASHALIRRRFCRSAEQSTKSADCLSSRLILWLRDRDSNPDRLIQRNRRAETAKTPEKSTFQPADSVVFLTSQLNDSLYFMSI